jgi:signal transduction histidine kinase/CheY-like chemotaxis protein
MVAVQATGQQHAFLSTELARPGERRFARFVVVASLVAFIAGMPFVRTPLLPMPAFIPAYEAALWINDTLTAVLLFSQFGRLRSRALLALAAGFLFDGFMVIAHALSFPGVFSATGLMGSGSQTTAWLYVFWHCGFPLFVLAYAIMVRRPSDIIKGSPLEAIASAVVGVALLAAMLTLLTTTGHDLLPTVIEDGNYTLLVTTGVSPAILVITAGALLVLWLRSLPTVLELWLTVAMVAWLLGIAFSAVVGASRYDLGFYVGRLYGLLAASFVLGVFLFEINRLYAKAADALTLAEVRNSELTRSREEFARVQRFEAIGQLVGGVAHDFNNLLTVITGALDLTLRDQTLPPRSRRMLDMSMAAAHRGSELTGQLLTFARKQVLQPELLNPNEVIAQLQTFITRGTTERIEVTTRLSPVLWPAHLDRAQFETALVNLALNARDAMGGQGRLVITTSNITLDATAVADLMAGDYVRISVSDSGVGMQPDIVARAIDPFFTTKGVGKGSGLGLSQVYGFVRAASGGLRIDSEPGKGTTVEIYLPKSTDRPPRAQSFGLAPIRAADGDEKILVVEDDPDVLNVAVSGLLDLGYSVKTATNAGEAMDVLRREDDIDVLFSDIVMPGGMNGAQLAVEARRIRPNLKVLLTSGYTASALPDDQGVSESLEVLRKPYRREELASKLRLVIGG